MSRLKCLAALAAVSLTWGCAGAPQQTAENGSVAGAATMTASAAEPTQGEVMPGLVVDALDPAPESKVVCRDMLKHASNVIVTQCMTIADWKRFQRLQEQQAQSIVRMMQGGAYW